MFINIDKAILLELNLNYYKGDARRYIYIVSITIYIWRCIIGIKHSLYLKR